jgi:molecular chaperone GrpE
MDNFRKRQRRLADERVTADRERLLRAVLGVSDDLERALAADGTSAETLRQGVDLTHKSLMRVMDQEGVELIEAVGQPFDPTLHDAVSTVPHDEVGADPDTVVSVVQAGYWLDGRLLRAARVVVAV